MASVDKLKARLAKLEDKLFEARLEENKQFESIGWGAGMRRTHITSCTFSKTDRLRKQIDSIKQQIKEQED